MFILCPSHLNSYVSLIHSRSTLDEQSAAAGATAPEGPVENREAGGGRGNSRTKLTALWGRPKRKPMKTREEG